MSEEPKTWCAGGGTIHDMRRPITEEWLVANGFRIESGRGDPRMPIRSLAIGSDSKGGRPFMGSSDDLCIDVAPTSTAGEWFCWIAQREPYRHIHVRHMRETHELVRLYEGLTGCLWPGVL
jgi:hypothetical protein